MGGVEGGKGGGGRSGGGVRVAGCGGRMGVLSEWRSGWGGRERGCGIGMVVVGAGWGEDGMESVGW